MCGIAGLVNFTILPNHTASACNLQKHRGPDAQKEIQFGNVVLSHQRLSIIDLDARSDQPFIKNNLAIIFNGEIYNYQDLRQELLLNNKELVFQTTSDTEVLLELYRAKKEKCLDKLIGMFAFAIYELDTGRLFMARDHFGIKPIFYTTIGNSFAFASELKTLSVLPGFNKNINEFTLVASINYLWIPGNESMFSDTYKLPAAHYMVLDTRSTVLQPEIHCYWQIDSTIKHMDENSAIRQLRDCLEKSMQRHMVADVPVSCFLSGGLDSSLIAVLAAQTNSNLSTYTIGTNDEDKQIEQMPEDEKYARLVAQKFGFHHHEINITPDIVKELPHIVYALDEPIGDPAAINTYLICKAAKESGVKVLLSGMGADEIFFGYRRQKATLIAKKYKQLPAFIRKGIATISSALPLKVFGKGIRLTRWLKRFLSFADLSLEESYMRSYSYYNEKELNQLFKSDIKSSYRKLRQQHASYFNSNYDNDPINQMCFTDIHLFMQGLNLTYSDRASMAASVEVRVPFIDKEVVSLAMKIEGSLKYKNRTSKYILKKAAEKYLPKEIIYRPKASFGAPIRSWISNELKGLVDELLSEENIIKRGLFNYPYVKLIIDNDRKGIEDNAYRIYQLLTIELWCRRFLDT